MRKPRHLDHYHNQLLLTFLIGAATFAAFHPTWAQLSGLLNTAATIYWIWGE